MNHETESCAAAPAAAAAVPASRPLGPGISKAPEFLPWVGVGVAVALAPFLLLRENNLRRLLPLVVPLYARIERDDVLANEIRRDIIAVVQANPGITTQEVRRALEIGWGTAVHHLLVLERHGFLVSVKWGRNRDWYPGTQGPARERLALSALRRDAARAVFDVISAHPGIGQKELADELALHHTTVLFHVRRLETAQLIEVIREHRRARYFPASQARQAPNGNETSRGAAHPSA